ncbi:hypothetical protein BS50DRAFT_616970 [Corynespora cassiicola Philippines]|uniref:Uncharacterized protein n=1 Tax=Corynespora cassiicola Philippines TaxID=1448308 RepID=A0A2T2P7M6_CORCC|nr:hypothetical protein BS50DRAFT_616970 [Corynespora cassiicola Philippines]
MAESMAITASTLSEYIGPFVFDTKQLRSVLKTHLPSYREYDPKTWPLISAISISSSGEDYDGLKPLPWKVAYTTDIAKKYLENYGSTRKRTTSVRKGVAMHLLHRYFPANFNEFGTLKAEPGMSIREYNAWVRDVIGAGGSDGSAKKRKVAAPRSAVTPKPQSTTAGERRESFATDSMAESTWSDSPVPVLSTLRSTVSADTAFREIMEMLAGRPAEFGSEADLHAQLYQTQVELSEQTRRAELAESKVRQLEKQLRERETEMRHVKQEADAANGRMFEVWAGMRYLDAERREESDVQEDGDHAPCAETEKKQ